MKKSILYYAYDPMCSWCWGFIPTWKKLQEALPKEIEISYLLGGLAPDNDVPMPMPMRKSIQDTWHIIQQQTGVKFNFDFWDKCTPRRSSYPSCRAVIAAAAQGQGDEMKLAVQEAYYLRAMNISDNETLIAIAEEMGLDAAQFEQDLESEKTEEELDRQMDLSESLRIMSLPSLVLVTEEGQFPIHIDYVDHTKILEQINQCKTNKRKI